MQMLIKGIKLVLTMIVAIIFFLIVLIIFTSTKTPKNINGSTVNQDTNIVAYNLIDNEIIYNVENNNNSNTNGVLSAERKAVIERAKAMVEVKWTPKYNLTDKYGGYTFVKGKTYMGIPYSMDLCQISAVSDFLAKITGSKVVVGNDCSGFVSAAWGISRQTTLSLYDAVNNGTKVDGKAVCKIAWEDLKPGDAILLDNGKGKGHILLFISADSKDKNKLYVFEQNVSTSIPYEPLPVAREDVRDKATLIKEGYFPIKLATLK